MHPPSRPKCAIGDMKKLLAYIGVNNSYVHMSIDHTYKYNDVNYHITLFIEIKMELS